MTRRITNELTAKNKAGHGYKKLLIAILGNYGYLAGWTYLLKIYKKRSQFASKSIAFNNAFPQFCEVHLKGKPLLQPPDATSRLRPERNLRQLLELVGQRSEALPEQQRLRNKKDS
jgi:hypothetical protein